MSNTKTGKVPKKEYNFHIKSSDITFHDFEEKLTLKFIISIFVKPGYIFLTAYTLNLMNISTSYFILFVFYT